MVDLNTLVLPGSDLTLTSAAFINNRGEIAGAGVLPNGENRAVLLVPASAEESRPQMRSVHPNLHPLQRIRSLIIQRMQGPVLATGR